MEITLLFLPSVATFLLVTDFKDPTNRWGSLTLILASIGGLYSLFNPVMEGIFRQIADPGLIGFLRNLLTILFFKTSLCLFPVTLLIFTYYYSHSDDGWDRPRKPVLFFALLIPAAVMYIVPVSRIDFLSLRRFLLITDLWAVPYMAMAYCFLFKSVLSRNGKLIIERLITSIIIGLVSFLYLIAVYILPFYHYAMFIFNPYLVICFLGMVFLLAIRYGFLGFKVSVGNIYLDNAIKTVGSGVAVIDHNLRDKLIDISASASNIIAAASHDRSSIVQNTKTIMDSTGQISKVVERLHYYLHNITINPVQANLAAIVNEAITFFELRIQEQAILVDANLPRDLIIQGDRFYLVEALKNIFQNSLDAMKKGGSIHIEFSRSSKKVTLVITDTGCGFSQKDLPHVLKPFYTTKDPGRHFGLGLSYCYNIMQQHGGLLEIESIENIGTTVLLEFPLRKNYFF